MMKYAVVGFGLCLACVAVIAACAAYACAISLMGAIR
jgi:hypothetical protein